MVVHPQQLAQVVLYHPAAGANTAHVHSGNVHCVVVVCGGIYNIHIFYSSVCIVMYIYMCVCVCVCVCGKSELWEGGLSEQNIVAFIKVVVFKGVVQTMAYRCCGKLSIRIGVSQVFSCSYLAVTAWDFIRCELALLSRDYERCVSLCVLCVYKLSKVYTHFVGCLSANLVSPALLSRDCIYIIITM